MDEEMFEYYTEWADDELIWGKGMFNWCRNWSDTPVIDETDYSIEIPF